MTSIVNNRYMEQAFASSVPDELAVKIRRPGGLCTSIGVDTYESMARTLAILQTYLEGYPMEAAHRTEEDWTRVEDLPGNFCEYRYRIRPDTERVVTPPHPSCY